MPISRSEEHTSELQSHDNLVCRLLLEKKKKIHPVAVQFLVPPASPPLSCARPRRAGMSGAARARPEGLRRPGRSCLPFFFFLKGGAPRDIPFFPHRGLCPS